MAKKDLKRFLAGLGIVGLITAGGITLPGAHAAGSDEKKVKLAASG